MRAIGTLLVLLGGLIIAVPEIQASPIDATELEQFQNQGEKPNNEIAIAPVYGGIAAVSGLLMIAATERRE